MLDRIFERKRDEVAAAQARIPLGTIRTEAAAADPVRGFRAALERAEQPLALIAEVKRASPSRGVIRPSFDPVQVAEAYERAGAHCLSVLTDVEYFQGSATNLREARRATRLPCLRKDFLYDPYQIYEARAWGADAILLIVASLSMGQLKELQSLGRELAMDVLVEVHSRQEAEAAIEMGADLIGVNNRNLADFSTSLETSEQILPLLKPHALTVSESALTSKADLDRVGAAGARAVLIGTTFCEVPDIEAKVHEVMGW